MAAALGAAGFAVMFHGHDAADAYTTLTTTGVTSTATTYANNLSSTVSETFPSGLRSTLSVQAQSSIAGSMVTAYQATSYNTGVLSTTVASSWPMIYYGLIPGSRITTVAQSQAFVRTLESGFGLSSPGWSQFKDVGTVRLSFSRPLANPIITVGGPGLWCIGATSGSPVSNGAQCNGNAIVGVLSFNPQYTFTATAVGGSAVTPTLSVPTGAAGSARYYAATGNVYGPSVNNLVQAYNSTPEPVSSLLTALRQSYTLANTDPANNNAASVVSKVQINTGGQAVTSVDIQLSYQMVDFGPSTSTMVSAINTTNGGLSATYDPFYTLFNQQHSVEVSGVSTPASYGVAANSMSANSAGDYGATGAADGLAIGGNVVPYYPATANNTTPPPAPTAANNSNAGYDGVTAAQLTTLGVQAAPANVGQPISLTLPLANVAQPATLTGYLDFQAGGVFTGTNNQATTQVPAGATSATLTWTVPSNVATTQKASWLRLRLQYGATGSTTPPALAPTGWQDSGETEDYPITLDAPNPALSLTKQVCASYDANSQPTCAAGSDAGWAKSATIPYGADALWRVTATNDGNTALTQVRLSAEQLSGGTGYTTAGVAPDPTGVYSFGLLATGQSKSALLTTAGVTESRTAITNTARASGLPSDAAGTPTSSTPVDSDPDTATAITKGSPIPPNCGNSDVFVESTTMAQGAPIDLLRYDSNGNLLATAPLQTPPGYTPDGWPYGDIAISVDESTAYAITSDGTRLDRYDTTDGAFLGSIAVSGLPPGGATWNALSFDPSGNLLTGGLNTTGIFVIDMSTEGTGQVSGSKIADYPDASTSAGDFMTIDGGDIIASATPSSGAPDTSILYRIHPNGGGTYTIFEIGTIPLSWGLAKSGNYIFSASGNDRTLVKIPIPELPDAYTAASLSDRYTIVATYTGPGDSWWGAGSAEDGAPNCEAGIYALTKAADPPSGSVVSPGATISYTVTATDAESGNPVTGLVITDDLSEVASHAAFVAGSARLTVGAAPPVGVPDPGPDHLLVTAPVTLAAGESAVLTYQVTVSSDAYFVTLRNSVTALATSPQGDYGPAGHGTCDPYPCRTEHTTPGVLSVEKVAKNPAGAWAPIGGSTFQLLADDGGSPGAPIATLPVAPVGPASPGLFQIVGIRPGDYWLTETAAPAGYQLLAEAVRFTVAADGSVTIGAGGAGVATAAASDALGHFLITVRDVPAFSLPMTGGSANDAYARTGALLLLAAIALGVLARRPAARR
ncbi:MAG: SpaA isopeptide-forming pilin-related protein [Actinomycetia bacterium]|nr:SpaA isopeptide-forming pilin-related protein [Actinomycetes bacterium]